MSKAGKNYDVVQTIAAGIDEESVNGLVAFVEGEINKRTPEKEKEGSEKTISLINTELTRSAIMLAVAHGIVQRVKLAGHTAAKVTASNINIL